MLFHLILARELRRGVSNPVLYWVRTGSVAVGVAIGVMLLKETHLWTASAAIGRDIFRLTVWVGFGLSLLSGVLFSSGLLCEERREGSLALLFLTRLKGLDIVIGKLGAIGFLASQIVLGLIPLLALCMPLGGVSLAEFWRAVQLLLVTLLFSLSVGLYISALSKQISSAVLLTFAALVVSTGAITTADWFARAALAPEPLGGVIPGLVPAMISLPDAEYALSPNGFDNSLLFQAIVSITLIFLAGITLKRLSIAEGSAKASFGRRLNLASKFAERRALLRRNPVYWAALRKKWRWLGIYILFAFLLILWTAVLHIFDFSRNGQLISIYLIPPILHLLLKLAIAAEAVERFGTARNGEFELLLSTPIATHKLVKGHFQALVRQFAWPIVTLVAADLLFVFFYNPIDGSLVSGSIVGFLLVFTLAISLLIDTPALILRGLWNALRRENSLQALRQTIWEVILLPIPIYLAALILPSFFLSLGQEIFLAAGGGTPRDQAFVYIGAILAWWLVSFVSNVILQQKAAYLINSWLRYIAADPRGARAKLKRRFPHPEDSVSPSSSLCLNN